jgi:hypothetical protein
VTEFFVRWFGNAAGFVADWWIVLLGGVITAGMAVVMGADVVQTRRRNREREKHWDAVELNFRKELIKELQDAGYPVDEAETLSVWDQVYEELYHVQAEIRREAFHKRWDAKKALEAEARVRESAARIRKLRSQYRSERRRVA